MPLPNIPVFGVRFDIDKLQQHASGNYAETAWTILWRALDPSTVAGSSLWHGDTDATLNRRENVFCVAIQNADAACLKQAQSTLAASSEVNGVAASPLFTEGNDVAREPLPGDGHVDRNGQIIGQSFHARPALLRERPPRPAEQPPAAAAAPPSEAPGGEASATDAVAAAPVSPTEIPVTAATSVPNVAPELLPPELTYRKLLFSFEGRIGNGAYLAGVLLPIVAAFASGFVITLLVTAFNAAFGPVQRGSGLETFFTTVAIILLIVAFIVWFWTKLAVAAKRCHDMNVTAAVLLLALIPYVGIIVVLCLVFIPGTEGENRWGRTMRMR